ncbi:hypothetical protein F0562_009324 [Nyssa sinensis]|uniref:GH18 domain-containing protein n=1 Tax=Nyssa sinensis TaxID=561372 RepID=A0A5J5A0L7_9ASTE|nr:hypothetical protein F0562_009324 [Nyssa sinensis]
MELTWISLFLLFFLPSELPISSAQTWIKAGYWFSGSEFPVSDINSALFTHLICAFSGLNSSTYQLSISSSDNQSFSTFTATLQQKNPSIVTLLSIAGGSANSSDYSSMISQSSYRKSFIDSSIKTARLFGFHGLDFCWVSPSTDSDMANMATLFNEWRASIESESRNSSKQQLILTMAVQFSPYLDSVSFPVESIKKNLNWVHVMAYDYYMPQWANNTGAQAALYDPASEQNTDYGINSWINSGLSADKLVLGLPFYGYAWTLVNPNDNAIGAPAKGPAITEDGSMSYKDVKSYIQRYRAVSMYNATYVVNYCTIGSTWIGFDDVEVVKIKVAYAKKKSLLGYFAWQVPYDDNWLLSQAAAQEDVKDHRNKRRLLVIVLLTASAIVILLVGSMVGYLRRRVLRSKDKESRSKLGTDMADAGSTNAPNLKIFGFADIEVATNMFSFENKLGEGGYGPVHKENGVIQHEELHFRNVLNGGGIVSSEFPVPDINSALFTHLICAFADINSSTYQLSISPSDEPYFSTFTNTVKQKNPSIKTLLSIWGGKENSSKLSPMVSKSSYRKSFIESSIRTARLYGFHGLDLWWISPTTGSDMTNMGILFDEWRAAVNSEPRNSRESQLILTMAVHYSPILHSISYPIDSIRRNLNWVDVIAYDYYLPTRDNFTGAHAALYDPLSHLNTDFGIREWISKGLPTNQLVLGLPYHGYAWTLANPKNNDIGAPASGLAITADGSMSYRYIKWFIKSYGAASVYNSTYIVNYCTIGSFWIGFDDVDAIRVKVSYAKEKRLLGYNVFQVPNDDNWVLSLAAQGDAKDHRNNRRLLVIVLLTALAIVILLVGSMVWYLRKRVLRSKDTDKESRSKLGTDMADAGSTNAPNLKIFGFADIEVATNMFSFENKLGEGGYGPVHKLVLGLPYHGYAWTLANPKNNDIGAPASGLAITADGSVSYRYIKWFIKSYGAASVYNSTYIVNHCTIGSFWIGFDDVDAIRVKVSYAKEKRLLGYNVFQVPNDDVNWVLSLAAQGVVKDHRNNRRLLVIVLLTASAIAILLVGPMVWYLRRRVLRSKDTDKESRSKLGTDMADAGSTNAPNLKIFGFADIEVATNMFSFESKLGEGGYGPVYKVIFTFFYQCIQAFMSKGSRCTYIFRVE